MHTVIFVRNAYLEELSDHIASQGMYILGFSPYSPSFSPPPKKKVCNVHVLIVQKILSNILLNLEKSFLPYLLRSYIFDLFKIIS